MSYTETPHQARTFHKVKNLPEDLRCKSCNGAIQGEAKARFQAKTRAEAFAKAQARRSRRERLTYLV